MIERQVRNAIDAGDGDLRVAQLRRKIVAEPDNLGARIELARHYESSGVVELAAEHYRLACQRFADHAEVHRLLALILRKMALPEQAMVALEEFLRRHTEGPAELYSWLGILRDESGLREPAVQAHRMAVTLEPKTAAMHNNLGYSLLLGDRKPEAAAAFRQALALEPRSEIARNNLGLALADEPKDAVLHWQSVSGPAAAHNNLAAVLIEKGQYEEARQELGRALGYKRDHSAAWSNLHLLAELDGGAATMPAEMPSAWTRFLAALKSIFVSTKVESEKGAPLTASQRQQERPAGRRSPPRADRRPVAGIDQR